MDDLDDAIIEDTCRCQCCNMLFVLGGNDDVLVEVPGPDTPCIFCGGSGGGEDPATRCRACDGSGAVPTVNQLSLCVECAKAVHDAYQTLLRDAGVCEHGVNDGEWCEECNRDYKEAAKLYGEER